MTVTRATALRISTPGAAEAALAAKAAAPIAAIANISRIAVSPIALREG